MPERAPVDRALSAAMALGLLAFAAALSLLEIRSLDYWWQLRTGQWIVGHGAVPKSDVFTYTVAGARYVDMHWLFQLGLYGLYALGGHRAVVLAVAATVVGLLGIGARLAHARAHPEIAAGALGAMLLVASGRFLPRPDLVALAAFAVVLLLLERFRDRDDGWIWAVIPIQLLWANLHGTFAVGLAAIGMAFVGEALRGLGPEGLRKGALARLGTVGVLSAAAALANPNGLEGALFPLRQLGMITTRPETGSGGEPWVLEIARLLGPNAVLPPFATAATLGLAGLGLAAMLANLGIRRELRPEDPLLWGAFVMLTLSAHRNRAFLAVVSVPIVARNLGAVWDARPPPRWLRRGLALALCALLLAGVVEAGRTELFRRLGEPRRWGLGPAELFHADGAAAWIERHRPAGPLYHHQRDGGFLIWRLHPDYPVMIDGRLEIFGARRFRRLSAASPAGFRRLDRRWRFGTALLSYRYNADDPLLAALHRDPGWRLVFVDEVAALFVRVAPDAPQPVALDPSAPELFPPLPVDDPELADRVTTRARLLLATGQPRRALAVWEEAARDHAGLREDGLFPALLRVRAGRRQEARAMLARVAEDARQEPGTLIQVAGLMAAAGNVEGARNLEARAVALDPTLERGDDGRPTERARQERRLRRQVASLRAGLESFSTVALGIGLCALAVRRQRAARPPDGP